MSLLDLGQKLPCQNKSGDTVAQFDPIIPYSAKLTDPKSDRSPVKLLVTTGNATDEIYGAAATDGLWPFPRIVGTAHARMEDDKHGAIVLPETPMLARVVTGLDMDDPTDPLVLAPIVSDINGQFRSLFLSDGTAGTARILSFWHNLGGVRELDDGNWLCLVARIPPPILRGYLTSTSTKNGINGTADIVTSKGSAPAAETSTSYVRTEFHIPHIRNNYATVSAERHVLLTFVDGWFHLTAAEC